MFHEKQNLNSRNQHAIIKIKLQNVFSVDYFLIDKNALTSIMEDLVDIRNSLDDNPNRNRVWLLIIQIKRIKSSKNPKKKKYSDDDLRIEIENLNKSKSRHLPKPKAKVERKMDIDPCEINLYKNFY